MQLKKKKEPESANNLMFGNQGRNRERDIPMVEARLDSREITVRIRKQFSEKKKAGMDFGRAYISNCITLAIRNRIDILRSIAPKYTTETEKLYVSAFASRPVLQVKQKMEKTENQRTMANTFSDAISNYGAGLREDDLGEAYKRAGGAF
jgi:hypothetical protein